MARVFCIDWYEDDAACVAKEAGWSLHLSIQDAAAYLKEQASPHFGHSQPYAVEVPAEICEEVRRSPHGVFKSNPRESPYPAFAAHERDGKPAENGRKTVQNSGAKY
jgi:hypothetical protein